ncbi:hypothetical protein VE03_06818 [Pseudogymnoascus sp. 23342-1-I1]|nr:hypothetical protein VE03_06818 [Pseudogymnoascus sp. 23342-1-I1]
MHFPSSGFKAINALEVLEEEQFEDFKTGRYYPVNVGEIFSSRYQVVGKLGFAVTSTVWLARDLKFTEELLKAGLMQVFLSLDYLHTECQLVHTDIKGDNILQEIEDTSILDAFAKAEMDDPSPRKFINDAPVYASRRLELPRKFGNAVLSDFGSAVRGDEKRNHDAQPNVYRSPEVMLKTQWSYPVDIWNVGAVIWDLFEGRHMFYGNDPDGKGYSTRAHLAEVVGMLGLPPRDLIKRGLRSHEFFAEDGTWRADVEIPQNASLERSGEFLEGKNKDMFLDFMRGMLQWRPEDRKTAKELLEDPWLNDQID